MEWLPVQGVDDHPQVLGPQRPLCLEPGHPSHQQTSQSVPEEPPSSLSVPTPLGSVPSMCQV